MPELPEVETIVTDLKKQDIIGQTIAKVIVYNTNVVAKGSAILMIKNKKINNIYRRAKYIVFELEENWNLLVHLRMTGHIFLEDIDKKKEKHEHLEIILKDKKLVYYDPRVFGKIYLLKDLEGFFSNIGPEPLDESFILEDFQRFLENKTRVIKTILLDQNFIAGMGNIYANEALWHAKINPNTKGKDLSKSKIKKLFFAIKEVLLLGIKNRGTTLGNSKSNYSSILHKRGSNQHFLKAHGQSKCQRCGENIEKIKINQRSTYFCRDCQS